MKFAKQFTVLLLILSLLFPFPAAGEESSGALVRNGDFSDAMNDTDWIIGSDGSADDTGLEVVNSPFEENNPVFKLEASELQWTYAYSGLFQYINVLPSDSIMLRADVYMEKQENVWFTMGINYYREGESAPFDWSIHDLAPDASQFETVSVPFTAPPDTAYAQVYLLLKAEQPGGSGLAYVDNVGMILLRADQQDETSIALSWSVPPHLASAAARYHIEQDGEIIADTADSHYTVQALSPATAYRYKLIAVDEHDQPIYSSHELLTATRKLPGTVTIMPVGDSITYGGSDDSEQQAINIPGGYRAPLLQFIHNHPELPSVDYVGTRADHAAPDMTDREHEGHPGATPAQLLEKIKPSLQVLEPDIVLIYAGTNAMWSQAAQSAQQMKAMIAYMTEHYPQTEFIVATIADIYLADRPELLTYVEQYNEQLRSIVSHDFASAKVTLVEMHDKLPEALMLSDGFHPNEQGYEEMAHVWLDALHAIVTGANSNPSAPVLSEPQIIGDELNRIQLSWERSDDNYRIHHYEVQYSGDYIAPVTARVTDLHYITASLASGVYQLSVTAVDYAGNRSAPSSVQVTLTTNDDIPPTAPSDLRVEHNQPDGVVLSWLPGTDNQGVYGYRIAYNDDAVTVTDAVYDNGRYTYTLNGLKPDTLYTVSVSTLDYQLNNSEPSEAITFVSAALPPNQLAIKDINLHEGTLTLSWNAAADQDGISSYRVYVDGQFMMSTEQTVAVIPGLTPGQIYAFQVSAVDSHQTETERSEVFLSTFELAMPIGLTILDSTVDTISLSWHKVPGAAQYVIADENEEIASSESTNSQITNLKPDREYVLRVKAIDDYGNESAWSYSIAARTKPQPAPTSGTGGTGGLPPVFLPPSDQLTYSQQDGFTLLSFTPESQRAKNVLLGSEQTWQLHIPKDRPFDILQLKLDGELIALASSNIKTIEITVNNLKLKLLPGWIDANKGDDILLEIRINDLTDDQAAQVQLLRALSKSYTFTLTMNGQAISSLKQPISISITPEPAFNQVKGSIYYYLESDANWIRADSNAADSGYTETLIRQFAKYALFESGKTFMDIADHWAKADIEALAFRGIVSGVSENHYMPAQEVTRAQFAAMLVRLLKLEAAEEDIPFTDVQESDWFYKEVKAAYQAGLVQGFSTERFAPNRWITREQMAVMMMNAYMYAVEQGIEIEQLEDAASPMVFADEDTINDWAKQHVRAAAVLEIINGINGRFEPQAISTRAQAAVVMSRLLAIIETNGQASHH